MYTNKNEMEFWAEKLNKKQEKLDKFQEFVIGLIWTLHQMKLMSDKQFNKVYEKVQWIYIRKFEKYYDEIYWNNVYNKPF